MVPFPPCTIMATVNSTRQKRQSCEACREHPPSPRPCRAHIRISEPANHDASAAPTGKRKLKCTGEGRGCSRCLALNVPCSYQDQGRSGRPRKVRSPHQRACRPSVSEEAAAASTISSLSSLSSLSTISTDSTTTNRPASRLSNPPSSTMTDDTSPDSLREIEKVLSELGPFPLLPPDVSVVDDFGSLPLDQLSHCHVPRQPPPPPPPAASDVPASDTALARRLSPAHSTKADETEALCHCADDVAVTVRTLQHRVLSHTMLADLRGGADLMERLLSCPLCYNLTKPPRLTIQNVLLIGRLMHEVTLGYRRYLHWVQDTWSDQEAGGQQGGPQGGQQQDSEPGSDAAPVDRKRETVYLASSPRSGPLVGLEISRSRFSELVMDGLRADAVRLTDLGMRFAVRQHNRHLVGHEMCPDPQGRCWREWYGLGSDPLDICPRNSAARTLIPCYRVVDAIRLGIKAFSDDVRVNGRLLT